MQDACAVEFGYAATGCHFQFSNDLPGQIAEADVLEFHVIIDAVARSFPSETGLLPPAEQNG
jgi:hypothetical protein